MTRTMILTKAGLLFIACVAITRASDEYNDDCSDGVSNLSSKKSKFRPSPRPFQLVAKGIQDTVGSVENFGSSTLAAEAFRLTGDTPFSRQLKQQEDEGIRQQSLKRWAIPSSIAYAGIVVVSFVSFHAGGTTKSFFQDIVPQSANILAVAWLPVVLLNASWIEVFSFATLLIQPTVRRFLVQDYLPETWSTLRKLIIGEVWRRVWSAVLKQMPKPLFTPGKDHFVSTPEWFQQEWRQFCDIIDKRVTGLIRKSVKQNFHDSVGIFYESMANSMMEITLLYEESSGENSPISDSSLFQFAGKELLAGEDKESTSGDESGDVQA